MINHTNHTNHTKGGNVEKYDYWWRKTREEVLKSWDGLCERCGELTEQPHVHHIYRHGPGNAYEVLCMDCHLSHHGQEKSESAARRRHPRCNRCGSLIDWGFTTMDKWAPMEIGYMGFHKCGISYASATSMWR